MKQPYLLLLAAILLVVLMYFIDSGRRPSATAATSVSANDTAPVSASDSEIANVVVARCAGCHGLQILVQHPHDRAGWEKTLDNMIARGAQVTPDEEPVLVDYLTRHFGSSSQ